MAQEFFNFVVLALNGEAERVFPVVGFGMEMGLTLHIIGKIYLTTDSFFKLTW